MKTKTKQPIYSKKIVCRCGHEINVVAVGNGLHEVLSQAGWSDETGKWVCPKCLKK